MVSISDFSEAHQRAHGSSIEFSAATVSGDGSVSVTLKTREGEVVGTGSNKKEARQDAVNKATEQGWPGTGLSRAERRQLDPYAGLGAMGDELRRGHYAEPPSSSFGRSGSKRRW